MRSRSLSGRSTESSQPSPRRFFPPLRKAILRGCSLLFSVAVVLLSQPTPARLQVEVTQGIEGGVPIAVIPFHGEPAGLVRRYHRVVSDDFSYSVLFSVVRADVSEPLPVGSTIGYDAWLAQGVEKLVVGEVTQDGEVQVELHDTVRRQRVRVFSILLDGARETDYIAHQVSDVIYEELTGFPGIFTTRIAFVATEHHTWRTHRNTLYISDADGHNTRAIYTSPHQLMSPAWSPDMKQIAYVSYESGQSRIVLQTLASGTREMLDAYTGPASLPHWSYDGRYIAYVSSAGGNPDIYVIEPGSKQVTRLTSDPAIDTEPAWSPDGTLIFTSDRSGTPQLYRLDDFSAEPERITFQGTYNSDADVSPGGDRIAFLSQRGGQFVIVTRDLSGDDWEEVELASGAGAEGPRFTANGQLLGYITERDGRSVFGLMTADGVFGKLLPLPASDVRGARWSPFTW